MRGWALFGSSRNASPPLEQGVIFRFWALKKVSIFAFFILKWAGTPLCEIYGSTLPPLLRSRDNITTNTQMQWGHVEAKRALKYQHTPGDLSHVTCRRYVFAFVRAAYHSSRSILHVKAP